MNDEYKNSFEELDQFEKELIKVNETSTSLNFIDNLFDSYDNESFITNYGYAFNENYSFRGSLRYSDSFLKYDEEDCIFVFQGE